MQHGCKLMVWYCQDEWDERASYGACYVLAPKSLEPSEVVGLRIGRVALLRINVESDGVFYDFALPETRILVAPLVCYATVCGD